MTDFEPEEDLPPVAHVILVYNGPVAPHWQMNVRYGDQKMLDDFWTRVNARLLLLPKHDPQFRRNRERVNRDAERERIVCDWDLGEDDAETTTTPVVDVAAQAQAAAEAETAAAEQEAPVAEADASEAEAPEADAPEADAAEAAAPEADAPEADPESPVSDEAPAEPVSDEGGTEAGAEAVEEAEAAAGHS